MATMKRKENSVAYIANLLTSILLCYPEIAAINLDPKTNLASFIFYISGSLTCDVIDDFKMRLKQSLDAYHFIINRDAEICSFSLQAQESFTILEFQRDVLTMTQKEVALVIALLQEQFGENLITDEDGDLLIDDFSLHEELIGRMLEHTNGTSTNSRLIALRDEGRVLVFNK
jgi:hypothetical protein